MAPVSRPDLNLLVTLDVLLAEGSVARAAKRLGLSPSAMSRALSRLRATTGDPLLVRAGRGLVPSPRALELRERVARLVQDGEAILRPVEHIDLNTLERVFILRTTEGFVETFGPSLIARVSKDAPSIRLRFIPKLDKDSASMRDGSVDFETGVLSPAIGPEVKAQALFRDRFIGVVRRNHNLSRGRISLKRYAAGQHIHISREGLEMGPVDAALKLLGLKREIAATVGGFSTALALARSSDLIATVPERHTEGARVGMFSFSLPYSVPEFTVSLLWHPRLEADPAHRWLRDRVREVCASPLRSARGNTAKI